MAGPGLTLVMVTHDSAVAKRAQRRLHIKHGKVLRAPNSAPLGRRRGLRPGGCARHREPVLAVLPHRLITADATGMTSDGGCPSPCGGSLQRLVDREEQPSAAFATVPCLMWRRRSARLATAESCVTITSVRPRSRQSPSMRSMISSRVSSSRLPVGSSARSTSGSFTRARAIATRCCCPPESSPGTCPARSARPTDASASSARRASLLRADAERRERRLHVLLRREGRDQVEALEHEADLLRADAAELAIGQVRQLRLARG